MPDTQDFDFDVLIVGGGPVGMLLASELRISRAKPVVLERLPERTPHSKAFGLHARSLESLDRRGLRSTRTISRRVSTLLLPILITARRTSSTVRVHRTRAITAAR